MRDFNATTSGLTAEGRTRAALLADEIDRAGAAPEWRAVDGASPYRFSTGESATLDRPAPADFHAAAAAAAPDVGEIEAPALDFTTRAAPVGAGGGTTSITTAAALPTWSNTRIADYLETGYWDSVNYQPHAFNMGSSGLAANSGRLTYNVTGLTSAGANLAATALALYEEILGIDFVRTTASAADIRFDDAASGARTSVTSFSGGQTVSANVNISTQWLADNGSTVTSYGFQTYLHEIGHALGLGHAGPYDGSAIYVSDTNDPDYGDNSNVYLNDSYQASMMSYFSPGESAGTDASDVDLISPMVADWMALDALYGLDGGFAGNTTWGFDTNITTTLFARLASYADDAMFTIVDGSGTDTVDFSGYGADQVIDLNAGRYSSVGGLDGNMSIAAGTRIENAVGGAGDDRLTGNSAANDLSGGAGDDTLDGGSGGDTLRGRSGDDTYYVGNSADRVIEASASGGTDRVRSTINYVLPENVEELVIDASGGRRATGNDAANYLRGDSGADTLRGDVGADTLVGGAGADTLIGGFGDDVFRYGGVAASSPGARDTLRGEDGAAAFSQPGSGSGDRIDLSDIDARTGVSGGQSFIFGDSRAAGHLWAFNSGTDTILRGNVGGDSSPEFELAIEDGETLASAYASGDFIL